MIPPLDRMEIEDAGGGDARRLAAAIHRQLGELKGAVPVKEIALALDIEGIREESLTSFEGALVTTADRDRGRIVVNASANKQRRWYTVGHELLHFLNPLHKPTAELGFECRQSDMALGSSVGRRRLSWQQMQEVEANRLSIELLAPARLMHPYLKGDPDIERILPCAIALDISKVAAARRYIELHGAPLALVITKDGLVLYSDWADGFPMLRIEKNDRVPETKPTAAGQVASTMDEADRDVWLTYPDARTLYAQTLFQDNGHAMTMLLLDGGARDDDLGIDDGLRALAGSR